MEKLWVSMDTYGYTRYGLQSNAKGAFGCAFELVKGIPTLKYVNYFIKRIMMLREYGIVPFVVFDGGNLPIKSCTERERKE